MSKALRFLLTLALAIIILFPMLYAFPLSFFTPQDFTDTEAHFLPSVLSFRNYSLALGHRYFPRYVTNSIITATLAALLRSATAVMASFAFTHLSFKGKHVLLIALLSTLFIPSDALLYENYITTARLGLIDSYLGIVLPSVFSASSMLLTMGAYLSADKDIYDAARIDGSGDARYITKILVPLTAPVTVAIFIQTFISSFNSYLWPLLVTTRQRMRTVQIGITMLGFAEEGEYGAQFAAIVMITLPFIIMLLLSRKLIMNALRGSIK